MAKVNRWKPSKEKFGTIESLLIKFLEDFASGKIKILSDRNQHDWNMEFLTDVSYVIKSEITTKKHHFDKNNLGFFRKVEISVHIEESKNPAGTFTLIGKVLDERSYQGNWWIKEFRYVRLISSLGDVQYGEATYHQREKFYYIEK